MLTAKVQDLTSKIGGTQTYRLTNQTQSKENWTGKPSKLLEGRPLIKTNRKPGEIFAAVLKVAPGMLHNHPTYQALAGHLAKFYKNRLPWDEFAKVIPDEMRDVLSRLHIELRRCGYLICGADYREGQARIRYAQIRDVDHTRPIPGPLIPDLCTLCQRECVRKDFNGVMRQGVKRCWEC